MKRTFLIIVTGSPGSGKTSIGKRLARDLNLPFFSKDDIKEQLFDSLGWRNREWSKQLGRASIEVLFHFVETLLQAGEPLVVETAFIPRYHTQRFLELKHRFGFEPLQIRCTAHDEVLFERFTQRSGSAERHPGHVDHLMTYEQFENALHDGTYGPLEIGGACFEIDTTDWERSDYESVLTALRSALGPAEPQASA